MSDGPIITEELWNRWHKAEEKEDKDFKKMEKTIKYYFEIYGEDF